MGKIVLLILLILIIIMVGVIAFDSNRFVMREYTVLSDKLLKDHDFLFISDLHNKKYGKDNIRLINALEGISAEGCFIAGDMMTAIPGQDNSVAVSVTKYLSKRFPVYYSYGNHEYRAKIYKETYGDMFEEYNSLLSDSNVKMYDNECVHVEDVDIYALSIGREYYNRFKHCKMDASVIDSYLGNNDKSRFSVLLAHNPEYFENYSDWDADLVLSGHVHGGVVRLPFGKGIISPHFTLFPKYDGGLFERKNSKMIVNRGLGMHTIPFRLFNPAEIILIHLKRS